MKTQILKPLKNTATEPTECKTCLFDSSFVKIESDGECEMCKLHYAMRDAGHEPWEDVLKRIKKKGKGRRYDVIVGVSGGEDSSVLLYLATEVWKLRVLAFHINNRSNTPEAENNIRILRNKLNINFYEFFPAKQEYDDLADSLLKAGVPDADIHNDVHMAKLTFKLAKDNGIRVVLNGHSFREEGSSPKAWSFLDTTYLEDIYNRLTGKKLQYYDVLTMWDQIHAGLIGMERIMPYHYGDHDRQQVLKVLKQWGWQDYGAKHGENYYTKMVGCLLLPNKFKIDKRKTYLSAAIRESRMTKQFAKEILTTPMEFNIGVLDRHEEILHLINSSPIRKRSEFKQTNYKRWKPLLWVLVKLKVFPLSAYRKYT